MNSLVAIAFGGACGAVLRFLVSSGVYQWLGRGFPFGTLAVNVLGSFLIGLLTEALVLQRVAISLEYRSAILVGLFGSFTTFSTFSLETLSLLEQGHFFKAILNVFISICGCLFAVWLGLLLGRVLFSHSGGVIRWMGWSLPYAILVVNILGAFLVGLFSALLIYKSALSEEYRAVLVIVIAGLFVTLSSLYVVLYLIEEGRTFSKQLNVILGLFLANSLLYGASIWLGMWVGKQF